MTQRRPVQRNREDIQARKKRELYYRALFFCIALIIVVFDIIFFIAPDKEASETENRTLQQFPKLNFTTLTNGKFESSFDSYVADQFPGRDGWVRLKTSVDILSGKTESHNIFLGKDGYLIQNLMVPSEEDYQKKMEPIQSLVEAHSDLSFYALVAPSALSMLKNKLPANAPAGDEEGFFEKVKTDLTAKGITFIDVRDALKKAGKTEQIYYRTDHHWTTAGAYAAYQKMAEQLDLPGESTEYSHLLISDSFKGTLTASSGFRSNETDPIYVYLPKTPQEYSVSYVYEGKVTASFYETENLKVRDHYTVFFNGNYPQIRILTDSDSKKKLLVIKDSYANCFVPFLEGDYSSIVMVDPRYFTDDIDSLITSEGITDVLYLYSISSFAN